MPGTFFGIEIARRGINVHRTALDTTGHNIANANTPGYTRQEAVLKATNPYTKPDINSSVTPGQLGTGVGIAEMRRIRDDYLDYQLRGNISAGGYWQSNYDIALRVEATFPEPSGRGIKDVLVQFFNDWQNLNNSPRDPGIKAAVVESGQELAALFRQGYQQLDSIMKSIKSDHLLAGDVISGGLIKDQVDQVNNILTEIANLTDAIVQVKNLNQQPNDLLDKRDLLLDKLAEYGPVVTTVDNTGGMQIEFYGLEVLALDAATGKFQPETLQPVWDGNHTIIQCALSGFAVDLTDKASNTGDTKGSLLGLEASRLNTQRIIDDLNTLAQRLAEEVNDHHDPSNTIIFFANVGVDTAKNIKVNEALVIDPGRILGENALEVARLHTAATVDTNSDGTADTTFDSFFESIVAKVGGDTKTAGELVTNQQAIRKQIEALRESVSGVSLDEELTRLIQFQYGFQASSRVISTLDDMLDVIINRLF